MNDKSWFRYCHIGQDLHNSIMTISSWTLNKGEKKKKTEETKHADAGWESSDVSFFFFFNCFTQSLFVFISMLNC